MKLLFVDFFLPYVLGDSDFPAGGWAIQLTSWIKGLRSLGHDVGVLTWKGANAYVGKTVDFDLIETYDPADGIRFLRNIYLRIPSLYRCAREYNPDVIIQATANASTGFMALIARRLNKPFLYRLTSNVAADGGYKNKLSFFIRAIHHYGLRNTDIFVCQNKYQLDNILKRYPRKMGCVIHNPFSPPGKNNGQCKDSRRYVAWIGIFKKEKNLKLLYEIAGKIGDIPIKIAGRRGNQVDPETNEYLGKLRGCSNVEFVGYISRKDINDFHNHSAALLNTSHYEGFSNTFLESWNVGTPVIAPININPDNVITDHNIGYVYANDNEAVEELCKLWAMSSQDYTELGHTCRQYVSNHHSSEAIAKELIHQVQRII